MTTIEELHDKLNDCMVEAAGDHIPSEAICAAAYLMLMRAETIAKRDLIKRFKTLEDGLLKACVWKRDENGAWDADCGAKHEFTHAGPNENKFAACPYCGRKLEVGEILEQAKNAPRERPAVAGTLDGVVGSLDSAGGEQ